MFYPFYCYNRTFTVEVSMPVPEFESTRASEQESLHITRVVYSEPDNMEESSLMEDAPMECEESIT